VELLKQCAVFFLGVPKAPNMSIPKKIEKWNPCLQ
jgi:hypothetical protein